MRRSRLSRHLSRESRMKKQGRIRDINDKGIIQRLVRTGKHLGTSVIPAFMDVRSKTFNLYEVRGGFLVTNHYGDELVNASLYKSLDALKVHYPKGLKEFRIYHLPLLPMM